MWGCGGEAGKLAQTRKGAGEAILEKVHQNLFFLLGKDRRQREFSLTLAPSFRSAGPSGEEERGAGISSPDCRPLGGVGSILLLAGQVPYRWRG